MSAPLNRAHLACEKVQYARSGTMKRCAVSLLLACLGLAMLLLAISLTACDNAARKPVIATSQLPGVYTVELWSEYKYYELGEPVRLKATLTNVAKDTITFGSASGSVPVLDIELRTPGGEQTEERFWSKENPLQAKQLVTLAPRESLSISWTVTLSVRSAYRVLVRWTDPRVGERFATGTSISYGVLLPNP